MLLSQNRRRHKYGDLVTIVDGLEGGAHRQLSFSKTHIPTDQSIHGSSGLHVLFDGINRHQLICRFGVWKGCVKFNLPIRVRIKANPRASSAFGLDL